METSGRFYDKSTPRHEQRKRLRREQKDVGMRRKLHRPTAAEETELAGTHVRCDQDEPAPRLQRLSDAAEHCRRIGQVLDDVVHDHKIEGTLWDLGFLEGAIMKLNIRMFLSRT
jgi:hypothetical protein